MAENAEPALRDWSLDDRYARLEGRLFLTGTQALVKLPLLQAELDRRAGFDTAGFISGYRGSPLGNYDAALWAAKNQLAEKNIRFIPGVNEELAATAVWGAQQANTLAHLKARHDGVFGIWYGKGPGVDRCGDVFKHANLEGTAPLGGVLVLAGDDHGGKSSTLAHQSEQALMAAGLPVINPTGLRDYLRLGLYGWALSRASGLWVGFKCLTESVESSGTVDFGFEDVRFAPADIQLPPELRLPQSGGINVLGEEAVLFNHRLPAALAFVRANPIDDVVIAPKTKRLGLVTVGKAYGDTLSALASLDIDPARAAALGIGLYAMRLAWPIEAQGLRAFAQGYDEIVVIEEKRAFVEVQAKDALYALAADVRPAISGKSDPEGKPLLPHCGEISPAIVRAAFVERMRARAMVDAQLANRADEVAAIERSSALRTSGAPMRTPAFCSGCPHNSSTRAPEGSLALGGIGCHTMAINMPDRPTQRPTQMGGEGANWIGMAGFVERPHVFQNLGDGTYFHSGILAIRAAIAAKVNITYKLLFNDAVAMTGGQPVDGQQTAASIAHQLKAEGIGRLVIVTDDVARHADRAALPDDVTVHDRRELIAIEQELAATPGVTGIIYDQTCAAEKRRRRKRGTYPDPAKRYFINPAVCEGCGDCSKKSNCVSIEPEPTPFGFKRQVDQSSCNKDYSCVEGFCPSFVTIIGGEPRKAARAIAACDATPPLPEPTLKDLSDGHDIIVTGIGGTGVVTIGAIIGMAAHLAGKASLLLDLTGLSQKNGAVYSHVRLAEHPESLHAPRIGPARANALIGCDLLVSAAPETLKTLSAQTHVVLNSQLVPVAAFQQNRDMDLGGAAAYDAVLRATAAGQLVFDATTRAEAMFGNAILSNMMLLGAAWQKGLVPLPLAAMTRAIELNGVSVKANLAAFDAGRRMAHDPAFAAGVTAQDEASALPETLQAIEACHIRHLSQYQDARWAARYADFVARVARREAQVLPGSTLLASAVARNLGKLMAYKDEYEVARLHAEASFAALLDTRFEGTRQIRFNLAPPLLARRDPVTGHPRKREFGPWIGPVFTLLVRMKRLRGTPLDPFGYTAERRQERALIDEYRATITALLDRLTPDTHAAIAAIADLPDAVRGFGPIKHAAIIAYRARLGEALTKLDAPRAAALSPEEMFA